MSRTWCALVLGLVCGGWPGAAAVAQEAAVLDELKGLHERLTRPGVVVAAAEGRAALEKLEAWKLDAAALPDAPRAMLLRVQVYAALAVGDAARAAAAYERLAAADPGSRETLRAAWVVASATGDAPLARRTLDQLREQKLADAAALELRLARLRKVGEPAPELELKAQTPGKDGWIDGPTVPLAARDGVVLVLDFWRLRDKPSEKQSAALLALVTAYAGNPAVQFVGINADAPADVAAARKHAVDSGWTWPQYFEQVTGEAPLTRRAFDAGPPAWQVLIDAGGAVRAVGAAGDPAFEYAVRAAVAEARGQAAPVRPKNLAGTAAPVRPAKKEPAPPGEAAPSEAPKDAAAPTGQKGDLPHNDEAAGLLNQARAFIKAGRKTDAKKILREIIEKYPGTWEAQDAKERLEAL